MNLISNFLQKQKLINGISLLTLVSVTMPVFSRKRKMAKAKGSTACNFFLYCFRILVNHIYKCSHIQIHTFEGLFDADQLSFSNHA